MGDADRQRHGHPRAFRVAGRVVRETRAELLVEPHDPVVQLALGVGLPRHRPSIARTAPASMASTIRSKLTPVIITGTASSLQPPNRPRRGCSKASRPLLFLLMAEPSRRPASRHSAQFTHRPAACTPDWNSRQRRYHRPHCSTPRSPASDRHDDGRVTSSQLVERSTIDNTHRAAVLISDRSVLAWTMPRADKDDRHGSRC
jgi:hypothetical protein